MWVTWQIEVALQFIPVDGPPVIIARREILWTLSLPQLESNRHIFRIANVVIQAREDDLLAQASREQDPEPV